MGLLTSNEQGDLSPFIAHSKHRHPPLLSRHRRDTGARAVEGTKIPDPVPPASSRTSRAPIRRSRLYA